MANMLTCRFLRLFGARCVRHTIDSKPNFLPRLKGNQVGTDNVRLTLIRSKHGSGRGSKRGQLNKIRDKTSQGPRSSTTTSAATSGTELQDQNGNLAEHEFDNQYFNGILDRKLSEDDVLRVQGLDIDSKVITREDFNEFDSQYFQELGQKDVSQQRNVEPSALKKSAMTKPGRTIRGHYMFDDIDLKFFDDINSSFVHGNTTTRSPSNEQSMQDINEFDQQYFGRENLNSESTLSPQVSSETKPHAKRYMDTSLSEAEMYRQHLSNRKKNQEGGGEEQMKDLKNKSFEAHDKPARYQDVSNNDFVDHREVHLITDSSVDDFILDSIPPDVRGKLIANRQWEENKDELRVANHNLDDLEDSVVSALKAVKKTRNKRNKAGRAKEMKIYGSEDKSIPASEVPCSGCGANLQCQDNTRPGFVPSEKFTDLDLSKPFSSSVCQRCWYIIHRHTALNVSIPQDSYSDIIKAIRKNSSALVILMVDLLDFPCSIIKNLKDLIGSKRPVVIVGNKLDVLPKDEPKQERRLKDHLVSACVEMGVCDEDKVKHVELISAKSGYGVEKLITKILSLRVKKGDIYLLGTANVGKSTLFNRFLESDLCKAKASSMMGRATISQWPGTTLNLLRFPLINATKERMAQRTIRLKEKAEEEKKRKIEEEASRLKNKLYVDEGPRLMSYVEGDVGQTFKRKQKEEESSLPEEGDPFGLSLRVLEGNRDLMKKKKEKTVPFNPMEFQQSEWFYDTPGVIYEQQVLTTLTSEELRLVVPKRCIQPRSLVLKPGQTFFLGGLGRLDYLQGRESAFFTVFSSQALPIKVVDTQDAEAYYAETAGFNSFVVPIGGDERMQSFPSLVPTEFALQGIGRHKSVADILFSSAGWTSVTANQGMDVHVRAFTPGGLGCILRTPALLPYGFTLKGTRRSKTSPFYNVNKQKLLMYMR